MNFAQKYLKMFHGLQIAKDIQRIIQYFRRYQYVPIWSSLLSSVSESFIQNQAPSFALSFLHPTQIKKKLHIQKSVWFK